MNFSPFISNSIIVLAIISVFISPAIANDTATSAKLTEASAYSIARGGRLYDKWFKENKTGTPAIPNPNYPKEGQYKGKKGADWRCKECHGWDYKGKDGAYRAGKHFTGTIGLQNATRLSTDEIIKVLRNKTHGYSDLVLSNNDMLDLANFTKYGQIDISAQVNNKNKQVKGDEKQGKKHYETMCAVCHGLDGKDEDTPPLGKLANDNPWEVLHKISNGQPNNEMPALRTLGKDVAIDVISYIQKNLPKE
jgi:thiosulfate dehydrogenase